MIKRNKAVQDLIDVTLKVISGKTQKEAEEACVCGFCSQPIGEFRDRLSEKEFKISGLCQKCQDEVFGR